MVFFFDDRTMSFRVSGIVQDDIPSTRFVYLDSGVRATIKQVIALGKRFYDVRGQLDERLIVIRVDVGCT